MAAPRPVTPHFAEGASMSRTAASGIAWMPDRDQIEQSNLLAFLRAHKLPDYDTLVQRSEQDLAWFWDAFIRHSGLRFYKPYEQVVDLSRGAPWARWCVGGTTNIVLNCLDRHMDTPARDQQALVWEGEDGSVRAWSYAELNAAVCRCANWLRGEGFGVGDVIALYVPFLPESVAALLAIAKIGAIVEPLFSGFGVTALVERMNHAGAVAAVTVDGAMRRGAEVRLKPVLDEAAAAVPSLRRVLVIRARDGAVPMRAGRDCWWHETVDTQPASAPTEELEADAPLLLVYTSGTTGKPKGAILTHCGFATKVLLDLGLMMDFKPRDRILWMSDMGWVVGPLMALGATLMQGTMILAEGGPDYPEPGRMWRLVQDHRVSFLGVAPTIVRTLMRYGLEPVQRHDLSSLRATASTGEAWTPEAWHWFFEHVCRRRVPFHNWSGGTELSGGIICTTAIHPAKPCAFYGAMPGTGADIVDGEGRSVGPGEKGELALRQPSIGMTRGLWKDPGGERYLESYWNRIPGLWVHGDAAWRDEDGYWYITGRSDDVFNVAGKRVGPSEVESLLLSTGRLSMAAVVGAPDALKGTAVVCVCVPAPGVAADEALTATLTDAVVAGLGRPFRPREVFYVSDLPKTRNMKVMRRVVRAVYSGEPTGDLSSLLNPESVAELERIVAARQA
jgi:acetyl-CoA synthetase